MESDQASQATKSTYATLTVNESIINIKGNSILGFYDLNPAGTTISNSTINMSDNSSMSLNDMTLKDDSTINMYNNSSLVAENVELDSSKINLNDSVSMAGSTISEYDEGVFGLKRIFYWRHGIPMAVVVICLILLSFIIIRERTTLKKEYDIITKNNYQPQILKDNE